MKTLQALLLLSGVLAITSSKSTEAEQEGCKVPEEAKVADLEALRKEQYGDLTTAEFLEERTRGAETDGDGYPIFDEDIHDDHESDEDMHEDHESDKEDEYSSSGDEHDHEHWDDEESDEEHEEEFDEDEDEEGDEEDHEDDYNKEEELEVEPTAATSAIVTDTNVPEADDGSIIA